MKIRIPIVVGTHETKYGVDSYVRVIKKNETEKDVIEALQSYCEYDEDDPGYNEYFDSYTDVIIIDTDDIEVM